MTFFNYPAFYFEIDSVTASGTWRKQWNEGIWSLLLIKCHNKLGQGIFFLSRLQLGSSGRSCSWYRDKMERNLEVSRPQGEKLLCNNPPVSTVIMNTLGSSVENHHEPGLDQLCLEQSIDKPCGDWAWSYHSQEASPMHLFSIHSMWRLCGNMIPALENIHWCQVGIPGGNFNSY